MTLDDLISELQDLRDDVGGDVDVRLAQQPRWAFEYSIGEVVASDDDAAPAVYIGEGRQLGYLPAPAATALGWGRDR